MRRCGTMKLIVLLFQLGFVCASASLKPGFQFVYEKANQPFIPPPVSTQCERVRLKWSRNGNSTGPSPVAPYFLQVFSSVSPRPYKVAAGNGPTFDWDVPFPPNSIYQICMYDVFGTSGGCQSMYSVLPSTVTPLPCTNITTTPGLTLSSAKTSLGALSQYSYIDQCTTVAVTPSEGAPPFTLTIAAPNRTPFNITANSREEIAWKVALPFGTRFFLSVSSADGLSSSYGPLTVGGLGPEDCFGSDEMSPKTIGIAAGAGGGGLVLGLLLGAGAFYLFTRTRGKRLPPSREFRGLPVGDESTRPLKPVGAPSVMSHSMYLSGGTRSVADVPMTPFTSNIPLSHTPSTRFRDLQPSDSSMYTQEVSYMPSVAGSEPSTPHMPLRPLRAGESRRMLERQDSVNPYIEPPSAPSSPPPPSTITTSTVTENGYPRDVKRRMPSRDDTAMFTANGSTDDSSLSRRVSVASRAPTYVANPPPTRHQVFAIPEMDDHDLPPEYGRHVADSSYAPSTASSGRPSNRF